MNPIAKQRITSQQLHSQHFTRPEEVVSWLGAIQAQDYAGAKWSVGLRLPGCSDEAVEEAINEGKIVRTWVMRGTLHLVAREDVHWLLALLAPRIIMRNARRYRQLGLDEETMRRSNALLAGALEGGVGLSRDALRPVLEAAGIDTDGQRIFYMLQRASLDGLIGQVAPVKNKPVFVRLEATHSSLPERDEGLARLTERYFTAHGPATLDDFVWWSGLRTADARAGLEGAKARLVCAEMDGRIHWYAEAVPAAVEEGPATHLLAAFDPFLVSYRDRSASIAERDMEAWSRGKAMFSPSILQRGTVVGTWKRTIKPGTAMIETLPFQPLAAEDEAALVNAARRFGLFMGRDIVFK